MPGGRGIIFNLVPQTLHIDQNGVIIGRSALPYSGEDLLLGQDSIWILHKKAQEGELLRRQGDLSFILQNGLRVKMHGKASDLCSGRRHGVYEGEHRQSLL